jgi:hypothetical protein
MSLSEDEISRFVQGYANRWDRRAACGLDESSAVSVAAVVDAWYTGEAAWTKDSDKYSGGPGRFWAQVQRNQTKKKASSETKELILLCEVLRKIYSFCPNSADAERLFSELGRIVSVEKTSLKDSTMIQKAVIAADVRMQKRLARDARGEHGGISRTQQRFIDPGAVLKQLRSIDAGKWPTAEDNDEMVI